MASRDHYKTKAELIAELESLRRHLAGRQHDQSPAEGDHHYRWLVQLLPDAVCITCDGIIVYANDAAVRLFGAKSQDQLIGYRTDDFVSPDERQRIVARRAKLLATGAVPIQEQKRLRLDGSEVNIEILGIRMRWQGQPAVLSVMRDISSRVEGRSARIESERRLAALAENIPGAIYQCVLRSNGRLVFSYVSQGVRDLFGVEADAVMTHATALIKKIHLEDRTVLRDAIRRFYPELTPVELELRIPGDDGSVRGVRSIAQPRERDGPIFQVRSISVSYGPTAGWCFHMSARVFGICSVSRQTP